MADIVELPDLDGGPAAPSKPEFIGPVGQGALLAIVILSFRSHAAMLRVGKLAPALAICVVVHLMAFYLLARLGGVAVEVVSFFFGGAVVRFRRGETWFRINWLPLGGFVKMKGMIRSSPAAVEAGDWYHLPRIARAGICLAGPLAVLGLGLCVLGVSTLKADVLHLPIQLRDLLTRAPAAIGAILYFVDHAGFRDVLGATAVTFGLLNLLPLPIFNGGDAILQFFDFGPRSPWPARISVASLALILAVILFVVYSALAPSMR